MRVKVNFISRDDIVLNIGYNYYVQSFIYNNLDKEIGNRYHNKGFRVDNKMFKMFTFSKLRNDDRKPRYNSKTKMINLGKKVHLRISSMESDFLNSICNNIMKNNLVIKDNILRPTDIDVEDSSVIDRHINSGMIRVKMLSPVVVYSTENNKWKNFYSPFDEEFPERIKNNIYNKYRAYYNIEPVENNFKISFIGGKVKKQVDRFKNTTLIGYICRFELLGHPKLLRLAYYSGIGSKNSEGFGCIGILN